MENKKILSISIAAYNVEKYIEKALLSCLVRKELREKIEVLVINDGSMDATLKIAQKFENKYPEIYRVIDKKNGGYGSTINTSLYKAQGKYFRVLDGDDWLETQALEELIQKLEKRNEDVIFTHINKIYMDGEDIVKSVCEKYGEEEAGTTLQLSKKTNMVWSMHSMTVKTKMLSNNNVNILEKCFYTDMEYIFHIMRYMKTYFCIDISLYQYRLGRNGQSVSCAGRIKNREDIYKVFQRELDILQNEKIDNDVKREIIKNHVVNTGKCVIDCFILCPYNRKNRLKIKSIDVEIRSKNIEIYMAMEKRKMLRLLRITNYYLYGLYRWNELRKLNE